MEQLNHMVNFYLSSLLKVFFGGGGGGEDPDIILPLLQIQKRLYCILDSEFWVCSAHFCV